LFFREKKQLATIAGKEFSADEEVLKMTRRFSLKTAGSA
jgi:hypothetical protein